MVQFIRRFWLWFRTIIFGSDVSKSQIPQQTKSQTKVQTKPSITQQIKKRRGTLIWDSKQGTYRRAPRIGRNDPCECGKMRTFPCDVTKPMKFKNCCGA